MNIELLDGRITLKKYTMGSRFKGVTVSKGSKST